MGGAGATLVMLLLAASAQEYDDKMMEYDQVAMSDLQSCLLGTLGLRWASFRLPNPGCIASRWTGRGRIGAASPSIPTGKWCVPPFT